MDDEGEVEFDEYREQQRHWTSVRKKLVAARVKGEVEVTRMGDRILVSAPYSDDFRREANRLKIRFRPRTGRWSFHIRHHASLLRMLTDYHGAKSVPDWLRETPVSVRKPKRSLDQV